MIRRRSARATLFSAALLTSALVQLGHPSVAHADGGDNGVHTVETLTNQAYDFTTAGKYSEAIASYMKAYEISRAGAILFNIATIYDRKLHERALAMEYFRRYLQATDADPEFARKAAERLAVLKTEDAADAKARSVLPVAPPPAAPVPSTPPATTADASPSGSALKPVGFVLGAVGLAGVAGALVLGAIAKSNADDANQYCGAAACSTSTGVNDEHRAGDFATASTVTFISGAALVALGVTFVLVAPSGGSTSAGSLAVGPQVGAASEGLRIVGTF